MARKIKFIEGEYYHIFNRGAEKRELFNDKHDLRRFWEGITAFNSQKLTGSLREHIYHHMSSKEDFVTMEVSENPLIDVIAFCLNQNHFHFILTPVEDKGLEQFMHRLGLGYSSYFNIKYRRSGSLCQGPYKAVHIENNQQLLHTSVYVNLNDRVHRQKHDDTKFRDLVSESGVPRSSWGQYVNNKKGICKPDIVLDQFRNPEEYKKYAEEAFVDICRRKDLEDLRIESESE